MFAAVRLRAGWLAVGTALGLAGCAAMPTLPQIDLAMPTLPGFGPPPISAAMEPVPLGPVAESRVVAQPVSATAAQAGAFSTKPAFFVQWKPDMTGMTRRPRVDTSTPLPKYPESAMRSSVPIGVGRPWGSRDHRDRWRSTAQRWHGRRRRSSCRLSSMARRWPCAAGGSTISGRWTAGVRSGADPRCMRLLPAIALSRGSGGRAHDFSGDCFGCCGRGWRGRGACAGST